MGRTPAAADLCSVSLGTVWLKSFEAAGFKAEEPLTFKLTLHTFGWVEVINTDYPQIPVIHSARKILHLKNEDAWVTSFAYQEDNVMVLMELNETF